TSGLVELRDADGALVNTFDASGFSALWINALGGDDTIVIQPGALFSGGITVVGGDNGGNSDEVVIPDGTVNINFATNQVTNVVGGPVNLTGVENLTVNGSDGVADAYVVNNYGAPTDVVNLVLNGGDTNNNDGD